MVACVLSQQMGLIAASPEGQREGPKFFSKAKQTVESLCLRKERPPRVFLEGGKFV